MTTTSCWLLGIGVKLLLSGLIHIGNLKVEIGGAVHVVILDLIILPKNGQNLQSYYIMLALDTRYPHTDPYSVAHNAYTKVRVNYITGLIFFAMATDHRQKRPARLSCHREQALYCRSRLNPSPRQIR